MVERSIYNTKVINFGEATSESRKKYAFCRHVNLIIGNEMFKIHVICKSEKYVSYSVPLIVYLTSFFGLLLP